MSNEISSNISAVALACNDVRTIIVPIAALGSKVTSSYKQDSS